MPSPVPSSDFRSTRWVLDPDDFATGLDEPEPPPSDLVDRRTWFGIQQLPDDVSIRTSNQCGGLLRLLYHEWANWIELAGDPDAHDLLFDAMLDVGELHSATFCALHGYYRQAISSLRSAIETTTIGAYCQITGLNTEFTEWQEDARELKFGAALDELRRSSSGAAIDSYLNKRLTDSVFRSKSSTDPGGWIIRLHGEISDYAHSRPTATNAALWEASNGPIYVHNSFVLTARKAVETLVIGYLLVGMVRPRPLLPGSIRTLLGNTHIFPTSLAYEACNYVFPR